MINKSNARWKCIVMLSDAILDYNSEDYPNKEEEEAAEKAAEDEFIKDIGKFTEISMQEVVLVYFGDGDDEDGNLFKRCKESAIVLSGTEFPESVEPEAGSFGESGAEKNPMEIVLNETLKGVGIGTQEIPIEIENNQVRFTLNDDVYKMIFHIRASAFTPIDETVMDYVSVKREKDGKEVQPTSRPLRNNLCRFYFSNLKQGQYTVTLPDGEWICGAIVKKKIAIYNAGVSIPNSNKISTQNYDIYYVNTDKFMLDIKVDTNQDDEAEYLKVYYSIAPTEIDTAMGQEKKDSILDENYKCINNYDRSSGSFKQEINLVNVKNLKNNDQNDLSVLNGDYECRIRIMDGEDIAYESDPIFIRADMPTPTNTPEVVDNETIAVGETIDVKSVFSVSENDKTYYIALDGCEIICMDGASKKEVKGVKYENEKMSFLKKGEYLISIVSEDGSDTGKKICYKVDNKSWWQCILDWFKWK